MGVFVQFPAPQGLHVLVEEGVCSWLQDGPGVSQERGLGLTGAQESGMSLSTAWINWAQSLTRLVYALA